MAIATGARHALYYIAESTYGTTPATPAFTPIRHTGTSLALTKDGIQSQEVRDDRQIVDFRHGNKQVGGDVNCELSYSSFDDLLQAALGGTWATDTPSLGTDQLKVGTTRRSFSLLRKFDNITQYHLFTGCEVNTLNMSVAPNAMVTVDFGFIGQDVSASGSAPAGSTFNAASTTVPFDSFTGTINEGGGAVGVVTSLSLSLENGLETLFTVGSDTTSQPAIGRSNVTGSIDVYFEDSTLLNKFWNETASSIDFTLVDTAGNTYDFTLANVKYTGGQPDVSGEGPITISMPFQAMYDATEGSNLTIERTDV